MKRLLSILSAVAVATTALLTHAANDDTRWVRPVKETKAVTLDGKEYEFFEGEWFETREKGNGDIKFGDEYLKTNALKLTDSNDRDSLSRHAALGLAEHITILDDTLIVFDFAPVEMADSAKLIVANTIVSFKQLNVTDTVKLVDLKSAADTVFRISPSNNLAEIIKFDSLAKVTTTPPAQELDESKAKIEITPLMWIVIGIAAVLLVAIAVLCVMLVARNRKRKSNAGEDEEDHDDDSEGADENEEESESEDSFAMPLSSIQDSYALKQELAKVNASLSSANYTLSRLQKELEREKADKKETIEREANRIQEKADKEVEKAQKRAESAEEKARNIKQEVTEQFQGQIEELQKDIEGKENKLSETKKTLRDTTDELNARTNELATANRRIESQQKSIERFDSRLADAAFAQDYCRNIEALMEISAEVQNSAYALLKVDVEDQYLIYKAIARYNDKLSHINMPAFYSDVEMIERTGFVPKGTPIAAIDPALPASELDKLTVNYFFATYLKTYLDALVVFNESLAGLGNLLSDMPKEAVKIFADYRAKISMLASDLGISVLSVKVFDFIGTNTDLLATEVDAGYDLPGVILEIENALVSLAGAPKDGERIRVKVQM